MRYERTVDIAAPPAVTWQVMEDVERWPEWTESMAEVVRLDGGWPGPGSRVRIRQPRMPATVWKVTDCEPGAGFAWESKRPGAYTVAEHRIEATGDGGSRVTLSLEMSGPLARIAGALMSGVIRRYVNMEAAGLKQRSEQHAAAGSGSV